MTEKMPSDAEAVLIALGSNMPFEGLSGADLLRAALVALERHGVQALRCSRVWTSPSWPPGNDAPDYVNAVALVAPGSLAPMGLLQALQSVEQAFGRRRGLRNAPRTLDLDLLAYGRCIMDSPALTLPHPRLRERDFVLGPLCDILEAWRHPATGQTARQMLETLPNRSAAPSRAVLTTA
jgi:2-amino-4-hydroxy-6-hydroxymethyldihydropteridine diphosphokinase